MKKETKKGVAVVVKKSERCREFVEAANSTCERPASSSLRPYTNISEKIEKMRTPKLKRKPYRILLWNEIERADSESNKTCRKRQRTGCYRTQGS